MGVKPFEVLGFWEVPRRTLGSSASVQTASGARRAATAAGEESTDFVAKGLNTRSEHCGNLVHIYVCIYIHMCSTVSLQTLS